MGRKAKVCLAVMTVAIVLVAYYGMLLFDDHPNKPLDKDTDGLFEASATILAFVSLGSVLGVRFNTNTPQKNMVQFGGIIVILICSAIVIIVQTIIILGLCCFELYTHDYAKLMISTASCFLMSILGYVIFVSGQMDPRRG